ncbi:MAG: hypothetical protein Q9195_008456 [Heterodermia aff. obscurata]
MEIPSEATIKVEPDIVPEESDVLKCFATAAECGVEDEEVPNTVASINSTAFLRSVPSRRPPGRVVAVCTQQMSKNQRSIEPEERQAIYNLLKSFNSLGTFSNEMVKTLNIRNLLLNLLGETAITVKPYEYPEPLQRNASIILERLDIDIAAEAELEESKVSPTPDSVHKRRRKTKIQSPTSELSRLSMEDSHLQHVMRGIVIIGGSRRTYLLDRDHRPGPRDCKIAGNNGLVVGDWWPLRICALRDGAHGAIQAGIAGSSQTGAYSIVVSDHYSGLDKDLGDTLFYSGSNSHSNEDPKTPHVSFATKAMRASCAHRQPVRVIRSGKAEGKFAPRKGLRYDGLYSIEAEAIEKNAKGGAYVRFTLVRCPGQLEIDMSRPNRREKEAYDLLKEIA